MAAGPPHENRANPYPFYDELRKTPVARQPDGTYVVSTYREVVALLHDPRVTSDTRKRPGPNVPSPFEATIITEDPPEHDVNRRRMNRHFGPPVCPHMIADLEPDIRSLVAERLDAMKGKTRIDVVDEFAFPVPVTMICKVLGVPTGGRSRASTTGSRRAWTGSTSAPRRERRTSSAGWRRLTSRCLSCSSSSPICSSTTARSPARTCSPGWSATAVPEGCLSEQSAVSNAMLMLFAGHETSVNLIPHCVLSLLRHPDQLEKLRQPPS